MLSLSLPEIAAFLAFSAGSAVLFWRRLGPVVSRIRAAMDRAADAWGGVDQIALCGDLALELRMAGLVPAICISSFENSKGATR